MKVAYLAESPADEAALKILTEAIIGKSTIPIGHHLRHRGWPAVRNALPAVLKALHFNTDAEGLVFIVDSNGTPPHRAAHEQPNQSDPKCRLCQLRRIVDEVFQQVCPRRHQPPLKVALGLAVPAIEAWLLCGVDVHVTEAAWLNGIESGSQPYTALGLKEKLYGTSRPSLEVEIAAMTAAARRLASDLKLLETLFPVGFGALKSSLSCW